MIINNDCLDEMSKMKDNSISCIVCDPPYFLTNDNGSGFMGKSWDSIHDLSKYVWENSTFVSFAINFLSSMRLDQNTAEANTALESANIQQFPCEKGANDPVSLVPPFLLSQSAQKRNSAHLLVITRQELLELLKELSPHHIKLIEAQENGVKENVLYAIPILLLVNELNRIARKRVLQLPKVKDIEGKEIHLTSMVQAKIRNGIEVTIGTKLESSFTKETIGHVNIATSSAKENKFSAITLCHIEKEELTTWLTSLLCVIDAIRQSKTIPNYLIENFFKVVFSEALRICKPGSFVLAFSGPRTHHKLACAIENAGWEIRDCIMWIDGNGFPKSHNHFGIEGYGTALKPAYEPIIMAMKPCDGTFKKNAEKWGQAGINIDGCRIDYINEKDKEIAVCERPSKTLPGAYSGGFKGLDRSDRSHLKGRWPANILFDEEAAKMLDEQSGFSKSRPHKKSGPDPKKGGINCYGTGWSQVPDFLNDSGGASRFFYCAKASSKERNDGLDGLPDKPTHRLGAGIGEGKNPSAPSVDKNNHPTVKPLKLMRYLITLVMPPKDGVLLDPFAGSGSTIVAAHQLGFKAIGIEKSAEYCKIARKRLENVQVISKQKEPDLFDGVA